MASLEQGGWKETAKKWVIPGAIVAGILGMLAIAAA
jgi:hypothetical protein